MGRKFAIDAKSDPQYVRYECATSLGGDSKFIRLSAVMTWNGTPLSACHFDMIPEESDDQAPVDESAVLAAFEAIVSDTLAETGFGLLVKGEFGEFHDRYEDRYTGPAIDASVFCDEFADALSENMRRGAVRGMQVFMAGTETYL